jgi:Ca-activated chloride channel family protein
MDFKWQHIEWLYAAPLLLLAIVISAILFQRWRQKAWRILGINDRSERTVASLSTARLYTRYTLLALAVAFVCLSLANLQMSGQTGQVKRQGADVVFALDVSRSMLAEDLTPSRLEKAKLLISRTMDQLGGDRVGIIAYAGSAYPALPITTDYAAAKMALRAANPDAVPSQGTNLAAALDYATEYFNPASPAGRFVIVLTDGEDHEDLAAGSADPALRIQTMLVGLGTSSGGPIPMRRTSRGTTYKKDNNGEVVITKRDLEKLNSIGRTLDATVVDGNNTDPALKAIQDFLSGGDKADINEEIAINYESQFQWFLFPALFFLTLYLLLPAHKGRRMNGTWVIVLLLASHSTLHAQEADSLVVTATEGWTKHDYGKRIREGNENFEKGDLSGAAQAFAEAATAEPDAFEPLYNLGSTLMAAGEAEQAANVLLKSAQNTEDPLTQSNALYNAGNAFMAAEKYQEAVGAYAESLRKNPSQKDAVYNLNRALEQLKRQQQNEENQEQEQEQEDQNEEKEDPKNDQDEQQQENPKDDESKKEESQDDNQGENNQGDQQQDEQQNDEGEPQDEEGEDDKNTPKDGGDAKAKMTPEQIKGLLEAVQRAEEKTAEKMTAKKAKGKKKSGEKDW